MIKSVFIFLIATGFIVSVACSGNIDSHESLPYKMYLINNRYSGIMLLTGKVGTGLDKIEVEYNWDNNTNNMIRSASVYIAQLTDDLRDYSVIKSIKIDASPLKSKIKYIKNEYSIPTIKRGATIILWVNNIQPKNSSFVQFNKSDIFQRLDAIQLEQIRLTSIGINNDKDQLVMEVYRNQEE